MAVAGDAGVGPTGLASAGGEPLPGRTRVGYALGSVATGAFGTVPGLMLLPFLTDALGVAAIWAGVIVFAPKAWDVLLNPIAGRVSDRTVDPRGPRRPWLLRAGIALAVTFALLFGGPALGSAWLDAAWVLVAFLACATAYAFFQVPYVSMPAEITNAYHERTRLMTWRVAILALVILVAGASAPAIRDAIGGRDGYRVMGLVMAAVIVVGVLGVYFGTRHTRVGGIAAGAGTIRTQLGIVARNQQFRMLLITFVLQALAIGAMLAGVDYLSSEVLASPGASTVLFLCFVGPALALTPAWARLGRAIGKRRGYLASSVLLLLGATATVLSRVAPPAVIFAVVAVAGIGYAGAQLFPLAMLPDAAAADARRTGENRVGVFTGVWTAGETLGLALGPALFAVVLAIGGYRSSTGQAVTQPDSAITAIVLGFSVLPAILVAVSMIPLSRYHLTEEDL